MSAGFLVTAVQMSEASAWRARLVQPKQLKPFVTVELENVVFGAGLYADDVALLDVVALARIHDLRLSATDQIQLVVIVVMAVVFSSFLAQLKEASARDVAPLRLVGRG